MRRRHAYAETALFAIVAVALLMIATSSLHIKTLNAIYYSDVWANRGEILRAMIVLYGASFAVASACSFIMVHYWGSTLCMGCFRWMRFTWREIVDTFRWLFAAEEVRHHATWLVLIVAVGAALRSFFLTQPMRYDEAYTFLNFVNPGFLALFDYPLPNNHVLHTLLVRLSVGVLGAHPVAIRLPAFVAGLLSIPLTFTLTRSLNAKPLAGFVAASMVAVFPYLVLYDTMARGYSLLVFLSLCLVAIGLRVIRTPSVQLSVTMALPIALGLFVMPSFLFPTAGVLLWLALALMNQKHRAVWIFTHILIPCITIATAVTVILYSPVAFVSNGVHNIVANSIVHGRPWHQFLSSLPSHILYTASSFSRSIPAPLLVALVISLIGGLCVIARERRWTTFLLLPGSLAAAIVVLFAKHAIPYDRTWIYLLPLLFVFIDAGIAAIPRLSATYLKRATLVLSACAAIVLMNHNTISSYPDTGHFPEAPILVAILSNEMTPRDHLIVECPADAPMYFYMWYKNVPAQDRAADDTLAEREFVVVKPSCQSLSEMAKRNLRKLISIGDAQLYVSDTTYPLMFPSLSSAIVPNAATP